MEYISISEVAKSENVTYQTIWKRIQRREVPTHKIGELTVVHKDHVELLKKTKG